MTDKTIQQKNFEPTQRCKNLISSETEIIDLPVMKKKWRF